MPFKYDDQGNIVLGEASVGGKTVKLPVFIGPDGKEAPFDADSTVSTISRLNGEAKNHRERAEALDTELKPWKGSGITDIAAAVKALGIVKNLDDKKLVDAGEVERIKAEAIKSVEQQYAPVKEKAEKLEKQYKQEKLAGAFARSPLINGEKATIAIPAEFVQSYFGNSFDVNLETGAIVATDASGNKVYSQTRHGELADFDEALGILVNNHPRKDHILKGSGGSGSGATKNGKQDAGGKTQYTRAAFDAMSPMEKAKIGNEAALGKAVIVDN